MNIIEISSLQQAGLEVFSTLTEAQLRMELEPEKGLFIAESPKVIRVALDAGWEPTALLCESKHITGDAADIVERVGEIPIYTGDRELLAQLTRHRGTCWRDTYLYWRPRTARPTDWLHLDAWCIVCHAPQAVSCDS